MSSPPGARPRAPATALLTALVTTLVAAAVLVSALPARGATATPSVAIDARAAVEEYAAEFGVPGMVAVVLGRDGSVTTVPHGATSDGRTVTVDTRFRIASMSKAMTAVAVQQLAEAGRLRLDQPVAELLPGFAVDDPRGATITVRQLLSHTSGLEGADVDEFALPPPASADAVVRRLRAVPLAADPGTRFEYLNTDYDVLARIVEVRTGRPFGEHLRDAVLLPLGMGSTVATDRCDAAVPGLAPGHVGALGVQIAVPEIPSFCAGDGGVVTTAADLTRWLRFQTGSGIPLLTAASLRESHRPAPGTDGGYGLGWSIRTAPDGRTRVLHGGQIATFSSAIEMSSTGSGAFVLTDADGEPGLLAEQLVARADGLDPGPPPADPLRATHLLLLGLAVLAAALSSVAVARARRRAAVRRRRRAVVSLPALALVAGVLLLPGAWWLVTGTPTWTGWLMVAWLRPTATVLAGVLLTGGAAALLARARARRRT